MSSLASLSPHWRNKSTGKRPVGERKLQDSKASSDVDYLKALPLPHQKLALKFLLTDDICALCNGVGVRARKVCEDCAGSGLEGEYERVAAS
jgi:hypothetical protein